MSSSEPDHISAPSFGRDNYIIRHWRGDLSLGITFWINLCLFGLGYGVLAGLVIGYPSRWITHIIVPVIILGLALQCWQLVGLWRSAKKHTARGGRWIWAFLTRALVVFCWFYTFLALPRK